MTDSRCRRRWRAAACLAITLASAGCVSIDRRAYSEEPDRAATQAIAGAWQARAFYRTTGGLLGPASIAEALQLPVCDADTVEIATAPDGGLTFTFEQDGKPLLSRTYSAQDGLRTADSGAITLPGETTCRGGDLQAYCSISSTTLFVNAHRELVFVTSGDAAGIVTVVPMVIHSKHVSTFIRRTGDPDIDNVTLIR